MSDIVDRLQNALPHYKVAQEAADRIAELEGDNTRLKNELRNWMQNYQGWLDQCKAENARLRALLATGPDADDARAALGARVEGEECGCTALGARVEGEE